MKKSIIVFVLLVAIDIVHTMEKEQQSTHIACTKQEPINTYFLEPNQIQSYSEDRKKIANLSRALLQQLCVQANNIKGGSKEVHFRQLVAKLRLQEINLSSSLVYITPKDLARILIAIPTGKSYSVINGKLTKLEVSHYETEEDKAENELIKAVKVTNLQYEKESDLYYFLAPRKLATPISDLKKSGFQLTSSYNFESDATHHQKIVQQFNDLIAIK